MYCPKCATENGDGSKFCRKCGSNIALVPQAMSGMLAGALESDEAAKANNVAVKIENGIKKTLIGLCFAVVAMVMLLGRRPEGWAMMVPAAILIGKGMSQILALRYLKHAGLLTAPKASQPNPAGALDQTHRRLFDTPIPPSVTENTTRHMNYPAREQ